VLSGPSLTTPTSSCNVFVGEAAGVGTTQATNTILIGTTVNAGATLTNCVVIGNAASANYGIYGAGWTTISDSRDKTDVQPLPSSAGLALVNSLEPVKFVWDARPFIGANGEPEYPSKNGSEAIGFIAQEVYAAQNAAGIPYGQLAEDSNPEQYTVLLTQFVPPLVKAVQELSDALDALTVRVADLEAENAAQQIEIDNLQTDVSNLSSGKVSNPAEAPVAGQVLGWNGTRTQWVAN
jgi:hypothetical protein